MVNVVLYTYRVPIMVHHYILFHKTILSLALIPEFFDNTDYIIVIAVLVTYSCTPFADITKNINKIIILIQNCNILKNFKQF